MKKSVVGLLLFMLFAFPAIECVNAQGSNYEEIRLQKEIIRLAGEDKKEEALAKANEYITKYSGFWGYNVKGITLVSMGRYDEALSFYQTALRFAKKDRDRGYVYNNIGNLYMSQEKYSNALTYFQKAFNTMDTNIVHFIKMRMAKCYLYMGDVNKTKALYFEVYPILDDAEKYFEPNDRGKAYYSASFLACQLGRGGDDLYFANKYMHARRTDAARLFYAETLAFYGHIKVAKGHFALVDQSKVSPWSLAQWYWRIGDENKASHYLQKSLYELKTPAARENWKRSMRRSEKLPVDSWKNARDKKWFRQLVY